MNKFAVIGASGYIAPRHVEAIKFVNGELVALLDPYDGIGYIDKYYPNASYLGWIMFQYVLLIIYMTRILD